LGRRATRWPLDWGLSLLTFGRSPLRPRLCDRGPYALREIQRPRLNARTPNARRGAAVVRPGPRIGINQSSSLARARRLRATDQEKRLSSSPNTRLSPPAHAGSSAGAVEPPRSRPPDAPG